MSETIVPVQTIRAPRRSVSRLDRVARAAVFRRLGGLSGPGFAIRDTEGKRWFGERAHPVIIIDVLDARFYRKVLSGGSLGAADAYIAGDWRCDRLTDLLRVFVRNMQAADTMERGAAGLLNVISRAGHALRRNSHRGSRRNIHAHYDLGNDFFELFLDETMTYSCALFERDTMTLAEASTAKLDRLCRKLGLSSAHHLLEIGTGWGSLALHAARRYDCRVTTTTISEEQFNAARERVRAAGLEDRVTVLLEDYRDLEGTYDRIVSIEMIEAVGDRFLPAYFGQCSSLLAPNGLMAIQAITMPDQRYRQYLQSVDFIRTHVFPGSCVPSVQAMIGAIASATDLRLGHLEDITPHYARTLREWRHRFHAQRGAVLAQGYPESFLRLWEYYLCYCEAGFAERYVGTVQMVLAKPEAREAPILGRLDGRQS